jgi:hypothetical protein
MTTLQTYWLVDETGTKALVEGAAERDRFLPLGWAETAEPTGSEFVWARHEGVADPARFPAETLEAWAVKGWLPGPPPAPFDVFADVPVAVEPQPAAKAADKQQKPASKAEGN